MRRLLLSTLCLICSSILWAEDHDMGYGIELEASHKVAKKMESRLDAEIRTQDGLSDMERWSLGVSQSYKLTKWLKADAGYTLLMRNIPAHNSNKYSWEQYWSPRHRAYASLTGSWKLTKHLDFSLRERYQYTYEVERFVQRFHLDNGTRADDKVEGDEGEHLLRSRLQLKWSRKKCNWTPYFNVEFLNNLQDGMSLDQTRYIAGCDYKIDKKNAIGLSFRYKDKSDREDTKGHLISISYNYEF